LVLWERYIEYRAARRALREDAALAIATIPTYNAESATFEEFEEYEESVKSEVSEVSEISTESEESAKSVVTEQPANAVEPLTEEERGRLTWITRIFPKYTLLTLLYCLLTFVLIPVIIYTLSYIPFMMVPGPGHGLKDVVTYQKHIYEYHKNLHATHPFSSSWYEWPMMLRPIWFYQGHFLPEGKLSSIISFGNPLVWWPGFIAVLVSFFVVFRRKDKKLRMLLIAYSSQYLPWILVPRLTFIYHYFAMVPFLVLILTYYIKDFMEDHPAKKKWVYGYLAAVLLLFIIFYPLLSGAVISKSYSFWLRWLPGWNYF
jgi:dolichyl-phosphate-mannose-protein mannosyltransferase